MVVGRCLRQNSGAIYCGMLVANVANKSHQSPTTSMCRPDDFPDQDPCEAGHFEIKPADEDPLQQLPQLARFGLTFGVFFAKLSRQFTQAPAALADTDPLVATAPRAQAL